MERVNKRRNRLLWAGGILEAAVLGIFVLSLAGCAVILVKEFIKMKTVYAQPLIYVSVADGNDSYPGTLD